MYMSQIGKQRTLTRLIQGVTKSYEPSVLTTARTPPDVLTSRFAREVRLDDKSTKKATPLSKSPNKSPSTRVTPLVASIFKHTSRMSSETRKNSIASERTNSWYSAKKRVTKQGCSTSRTCPVKSPSIFPALYDRYLHEAQKNFRQLQGGAYEGLP